MCKELKPATLQVVGAEDVFSVLSVSFYVKKVCNRAGKCLPESVVVSTERILYYCQGIPTIPSVL